MGIDSDPANASFDSLDDAAAADDDDVKDVKAESGSTCLVDDPVPGPSGMTVWPEKNDNVTKVEKEDDDEEDEIQVLKVVWKTDKIRYVNLGDENANWMIASDPIGQPQFCLLYTSPSPRDS